MTPIPFPDLKPFTSELIILSAGLFLLILELFVKNKTVLSAVCIFASICVLFVLSDTQGITFNGMFVNDLYSMYFKIIFIINLVMTVLISINYIDREKPDRMEYYSLLLFATSGMMIMASAKDLVVLFLGLELMALSTYILAGIKTLNIKSNEAAIKYFMLGAFSSAFFLYGLAILYGLTGSTDIYQISEKIKTIEPSMALVLSMIMIVVAFSFKIAAAPFHMWAPDVYEGAPTSVTAFMSIGPKAAGFAVFGRVFYVAFDSIYTEWATALIVISIITMAVGNIIALSQTNIKRMLAYSSIAHAGYMLIGIITATGDSINAVLHYLLIYAFMNMGAFSIIILIEGGEQIKNYNGLAKRYPLVSALMLVFMFSLVGIPPTAGFIAKFNLFMSAINGGYLWLVIIAVIFSTISAFYYLRIVMNMYMKDNISDSIVFLNNSAPLAVAIFISTVMVIVIGVIPSLLI
ncbi:MAG TPA: NADH-quinone oxidoreductase subunit N [Nitrospirae bacterium]|nr:NADH-quinone oxidoreductase subunit N [Nitrospirota bacterium]